MLHALQIKSAPEQSLVLTKDSTVCAKYDRERNLKDMGRLPRVSVYLVHSLIARRNSRFIAAYDKY